jgi:urease accessory protein
MDVGGESGPRRGQARTARTEQSAGQRILHSLVPLLEQIAEQALSIEDEDVGACAIVQGLASARHESQYTRLFRS